MRYMFLCGYAPMRAVPAEAGRGSQIPWSWSQGWLWAAWPRDKTGPLQEPCMLLTPRHLSSPCRGILHRGQLRDWAMPCRARELAATENSALTPVLSIPGHWPSLHSQQPRELLCLAFPPRLHQPVQVLNPSPRRHLTRPCWSERWLRVRMTWSVNSVHFKPWLDTSERSHWEETQLPMGTYKCELHIRTGTEKQRYCK